MLGTSLGLIGLYALLPGLVMHALSFADHAGASSAGPVTGNAQAAYLIAAIGATCAAVAWLWHMRCATSPAVSRRQSLALTAPAWWTLPAAAAVGLGFAVAVASWVILTQNEPVTKQAVHGVALAADMPYRMLLAFCVIGLIPFVEECLFRGLLLNALMRTMHVVWAVLASSILFAGLHVIGQFIWQMLPVMFVFALILAVLRLYGRSLWLAIVAHAMNNFVVTLSWFGAGAVA